MSTLAPLFLFFEYSGEGKPENVSTSQKCDVDKGCSQCDWYFGWISYAAVNCIDPKHSNYHSNYVGGSYTFLIIFLFHNFIFIQKLLIL